MASRKTSTEQAEAVEVAAPETRGPSEVRFNKVTQIGGLSTTGLLVGKEGVVSLEEYRTGIVVVIEGRDKTQKRWVVPFSNVASYR